MAGVGDDVWLGPFGFTVDSDGFRELFHAENDRYMRVLGLIGTVCAGWVVPLAVVTFYIPFFTHDPSAHINRSDFWGVTGGFLIGLFFVLLLVAPPLPLTTRRAQEAAFMKYHGGAAGASEVGVRVWLCRYGFEEVTASGVVVRLPYALMRRPVLSRRFLFMGVRSAGRDSALWNSVGVNWVFRPDWDGSGGFVPRSCLDGAGGACGAAACGACGAVGAVAVSSGVCVGAAWPVAWRVGGPGPGVDGAGAGVA